MAAIRPYKFRSVSLSLLCASAPLREICIFPSNNWAVVSTQRSEGPLYSTCHPKALRSQRKTCQPLALLLSAAFEFNLPSLRPNDSAVYRRPLARRPWVFLCDLRASARDIQRAESFGAAWGDDPHSGPQTRISRRGAEIAEENRETLRGELT